MASRIIHLRYAYVYILVCSTELSALCLSVCLSLCVCLCLCIPMCLCVCLIWVISIAMFLTYSTGANSLFKYFARYVLRHIFAYIASRYPSPFKYYFYVPSHPTHMAPVPRTSETVHKPRPTIPELKQPRGKSCPHGFDLSTLS